MSELISSPFLTTISKYSPYSSNFTKFSIISNDSLFLTFTTITSNNLSADKVVVSDSNGKVTTGQVLSSELDYLSGTTSNIQTQLNNKVNTGFEVVAFQLPTISNGYVWYKKLANGWVEQGCLSMAPGIFNFPIEMNSAIYGVNVTPLGNNDNASVHANIVSTTSVEVDNENSWDMSVEVKGIAAII